jgi:hypothetical protein
MYTRPTASSTPPLTFTRPNCAPDSPEYSAWLSSLPAAPTPEQIQELAKVGIYHLDGLRDPWFDAEVELDVLFPTPTSTPLADNFEQLSDFPF